MGNEVGEGEERALNNRSSKAPNSPIKAKGTRTRSEVAATEGRGLWAVEGVSTSSADYASSYGI